jgi:hypothetical protein
MNKGIFCILLFSIIALSCMEIEEITGACEVYIFMEDGSIRFYEISQDVRRNKNTGVFTYRDEEGKLWSITQNPETEVWFSKSQGEEPRVVQRIECGNNVYLEEEDVETEQG